MQVRLAGNYDDSCSDLLRLCVQLSQITQEKSDRKWKIQARDVRYFGPFAASVLGAAYKLGCQRGQRPRIVLPTHPPELRAFCVFSGMESWFRKDGAKPDATHPESETVPLAQFDDADWSLGDGIVRLLTRHTHISPDFEDYLRTSVHEVAQNVKDHSGSSVGGLMCSRYLRHSNEVRVGIVDMGVGIFQTLSNAVDSIRSPVEAMRQVIRGGVSAKSRDNNMGLGISNLWNAVTQCGGSCTLVSHDVYASGTVSSYTCANLDRTFPGTVAAFTLAIDKM